MRRFWVPTAAAAAAVSVAIELLGRSGAHGASALEGIPGLDLLAGGAACALIVAFSKWLGKRFLQRPEAYYDQERT